ncbi:MAG: hypothetical protein WCO89_11965, partial [Syntrophus sp. (in: bacteria)]
MQRYALYLLRNLTLLNAMILTILVILGYFSLVPLLYTNIEVSLPKARTTSLYKTWNIPDFKNPPFTDFAKIPDHNLFHPDRKIIADKIPLPMPEIVLYGTLITDEVSVAYIEDKKAPQATPGRGKRQTAVKKGDSVSGFIVKEI